MPGETQFQFHSWSVVVLRYRSAEAKRLIEQGKVWELPNWQGLSTTASTVYFGWNERWASVRFYRACRDGMADPLVDHVLMLRDGRMVVCVVIDHTFPYGVPSPSQGRE